MKFNDDNFNYFFLKVPEFKIKLKKIEVNKNLPQDLLSKINKAWESKKETSNIFNGEFFCFSGFVCHPDFLEIDVYADFFKNYIGFTEGDMDKKNFQSFFPTPLNFTALILSSDGYLFIGKRSNHVYGNKGLFGLWGGIVSPKEVPDLDPYKAVLLELSEEIPGINEHITSLNYLGLFFYRGDSGAYIKNSSLIFEAKTKLNSSEFSELFSKTNSKEHFGFHKLKNEPSSIKDFLEKEKNNFTNDCYFTLKSYC